MAVVELSYKIKGMTRLVVLCQYKDELRVSALAEKCAESGFHVLVAPPLYHIPEKSPLWEQLSGCGPISAVWSSLNPRPAKWLLHRHALYCKTYRYESYDSVDACLGAMVELSGDGSSSDEIAGSDAALPAINSSDPQKLRWYPVVDKSRCDNCGQCLQFCLFGVYSRDEAQVVAASNPDACKAGCPACSRICPKGAIMFPLYSRDPAICGAPGVFMSPDKTSRRMFYIRTKQACPICKTIPSGAAPDQENTCPECGSAYVPPKSPIQDDIDSLIDALDASV
jgi:NAD-dependent dihydropyrimidine dehydrogenase PreA subunit